MKAPALTRAIRTSESASLSLSCFQKGSADGAHLGCCATELSLINHAAVRCVPWRLRDPPSSYKQFTAGEAERADHAWTNIMQRNGRIYPSEEHQLVSARPGGGPRSCRGRSACWVRLLVAAMLAASVFFTAENFTVNKLFTPRV